jgi:alpha-glucoside transport system permease protein
MSPQNRERLVNILNRVPVNAAVIVLCLIWLLPTLGLLITSFRPQEVINTSGWWQVASSNTPSTTEYETYCSTCHGENLDAISVADLSDAEFVGQYTTSRRLLATFNREYDGVVHLPENKRPNDEELVAILDYIRAESGAEELPPRLTIANYKDVLVGYTAAGSSTYDKTCEEDGPVPGTRSCDFLDDALRENTVFKAMINSFILVIPATILPILLAGFAAYAFAWLDFNGRKVLFAILVGLQVVPLQMTLVPIFRLYNDLHLNGTFLGVWLFHTGFGLPYSIYLMRNFIGALPRELFESAYLDGANHFGVFRLIVMPLALPAIAALAIFQFLWVWNDLLVALIFLGGKTPVLTYQVNQMVSSLGGGWHRMTAAAFISILVPLIVFMAFQRFFVRGLLAGSVKG